MALSCFHLPTGTNQINITFCNKNVEHEYRPVYLGIKLDRSLIYQCHLKKLIKDFKIPPNLMHRLLGYHSNRILHVYIGSKQTYLPVRQLVKSSYANSIEHQQQTIGRENVQNFKIEEEFFFNTAMSNFMHHEKYV